MGLYFVIFWGDFTFGMRHIKVSFIPLGITPELRALSTQFVTLVPTISQYFFIEDRGHTIRPRDLCWVYLLEGSSHFLCLEFYYQTVIHFGGDPLVYGLKTIVKISGMIRLENGLKVLQNGALWFMVAILFFLHLWLAIA